MDLVTVINNRFVRSAENLIRSYKHFSYDSSIFLYWFGELTEEIRNLEKNYKVNLLEVPKLTDYAHNPKAFFYKSFALADAIEKTSKFIYSDSTNCFISEAKDIHLDLVDSSLFLPYSNPLLTNQFWTTKECFLTLGEVYGSGFMPQYWAGFQAYDKTETNYKMIKELLSLSLIKEAILPDTSVKKPDGPEGTCIEHRQDQSILSILIHKYNKHQRFDPVKSDKYGDWQTINNFDNYSTLDPTSKSRVLMPRESKFGFYRFL